MGYGQYAAQGYSGTFSPARRVRHLAGYHECVRAWLGQQRDGGKAGGGRMYFTGPTLYSYGSHYPMARIVTGADGESAVLVNSDSSSATTNKHMSIVRGAVHGMRHVFYVPTRALKLWDDHRKDAQGLAAHGEAIEHYRLEAKEQFAKAMNPRSRKKEEYAARAMHYLDSANAYAKFFGLTPPFNTANTPEAVMLAYALGDDRALVEFLVKEGK